MATKKEKLAEKEAIGLFDFSGNGTDNAGLEEAKAKAEAEAEKARAEAEQAKAEAAQAKAEAEKAKAEAAKARAEAEKKEEDKKVTYSSRLPKNLVETFKLFCLCKGGKSAEALADAINEYMKNHPLDKTEAKLFKERQKKM